MFLINHFLVSRLIIIRKITVGCIVVLVKVIVCISWVFNLNFRSLVSTARFFILLTKVQAIAAQIKLHVLKMLEDRKV